MLFDLLHFIIDLFEYICIKSLFASSPISHNKKMLYIFLCLTIVCTTTSLQSIDPAPMPFSRVLPFAAYKEPPFSQKGSRAHLMQKYPKTLNISQEDMQEPFTVPSTVYADIFDIAPSGRWMHTMKMVGSKIYVFGGIASYGKAFLNDIWLRNEIMKRWDILQQNFIPPVPGRDSMQIPSLFGGQWQSQLDPSSTTSARPYSLPKPPPMRRAPFRTIDQRNQRERKGSIMYPDITKTSFPIGDMWQYDLGLSYLIFSYDRPQSVEFSSFHRRLNCSSRGKVWALFLCA